MRPEGDRHCQMACIKQGKGAAASNKKFLWSDRGRKKNGDTTQNGDPIAKELEAQNKLS